MTEKVTNKNQPCSICGEVKFNYRQYGEYYCNNPAHSPIRKKKPYPVTETNKERLERLKDINDIKHVVALNHPSNDGNNTWTIDLERDVDWLIEQAGLVPTLREQESILNYEGKQLVDENKRLREALEFYASEYAWKESVHETVEGDRYPDAPPIIHDGGEKARQALETSP